jgi:hypothetical protein
MGVGVLHLLGAPIHVFKKAGSDLIKVIPYSTRAE